MQESLLRVLMRDGPSAGSAVASALGVSQPTFSRLVRSAGDDVVVGGRSRQTRYAARRRILGVASSVPVFVVDVAGVARQAGTLQPVHPGLLWLSSSSSSSPLWLDDLPWWLADLRPAGFLGRQVPRRHSELELPADVRLWSSDHVLRFITRYGDDQIGHVIVGERALERFQMRPASHVVIDVDADYPRLADLELQAGTPGSSAGGEQPKFLTRRRDEAGVVNDVLVKFSPPTDSAVGRRVADLLVCEHLALEALSATGVSVAKTRVLSSAGRTFLEVERFDRLPGGGRRGLASLGALDDALVGGDRHDWPSTTQALRRLKLITDDDHRRARIAWAFGRLIDNSDMHRGNLSFLVDDALQLAGLAPIYDMLPMLHAPIAGQLVERPPVPVHLGPVDDDIRALVEDAASSFWAAVIDDDRIEDGLRRVARVHLDQRGRHSGSPLPLGEGQG